MFLSDESAFYKCPDRLRLPLIFYFGHTAAVYVNKLVLGGLLKVYLFLKTHMYVYTVLVLFRVVIKSWGPGIFPGY